MNETCSAWFFRQEKIRGGSSTITSLKDFKMEQGQVVYTDGLKVTQEGMAEVTTRYYSTLHRKQHTNNASQDRTARMLPAVDPEVVAELDGLVGVKETAEAVSYIGPRIMGRPLAWTLKLLQINT